MNKLTWAGGALVAVLVVACGKSSCERPAESAASQGAPVAAPPSQGAVQTTGATVGAEVGSAAKPEEPKVADLLGVEWRWSRFADPVAGNLDVSHPEDYSLILKEDGRAEVHSDCNNGTGVYSFNGNQLSVRITKMTLDTCGENSLTTEFVDNLNSSANFFTQDGNLYIDLRYDSGTMRFARGPKVD